MQKSGASNTRFSPLLFRVEVNIVFLPQTTIKADLKNTIGSLGSPSSSSLNTDVNEVDHVLEVRSTHHAMPTAGNDCSAVNHVPCKDSPSSPSDSLLLTKRVGISSIKASVRQVHEFYLESRDFTRRKLSVPYGAGVNLASSSSFRNQLNQTDANNSNRHIFGGVGSKKYSDLSDVHCFSVETKFHSFSSTRKFVKRNLIDTLLFRRNPIIAIVHCEEKAEEDSSVERIIIPLSSSDRTNQKKKDSRKQSSTPASSSSSTSSSSTLSEKPEETTATTESNMKEEKQIEFILKSLVAGGVAGMCAKTAVAPLDRMKILLQAHSKHYSHLGVFSGLRGIVQKESLIALYKGNGAQMVRIFPYAATQFTSFEQFKKLFGEKSHIARFGAGSCAGVTAVALTYPLDTIRARLAFQVTGEHVYSGIYNCALHIFREEGGIRALYRGFIPTVCGMIPYAGLSFYCFESFKYTCMKHFPAYTCKRHSTNTGGLVLLVYAKLICGGVAGAVAQTVSYPMDVTRRRMQLAMMNENTKKFGMGMLSTIRLIYQENGVVRGLYRGMSINYLRAIPMVAVSFSTYELVKQMLNLDTGLAIKTG